MYFITVQYTASACSLLFAFKCCGCYGPKNGKKNYCFKECDSQNGGTIRKNVYTWFWVRSSIPRRLWSKCMDYKVMENGAAVWYKLIGDSELPVKVGIPGVPKKAMHCLISCNVRFIKAISLK